VIREAGCIRNDFTVGLTSASNVANRHFAQSASSFARAMELQQPRHKTSSKHLEDFCEDKLRYAMGGIYCRRKIKGKELSKIES